MYTQTLILILQTSTVPVVLISGIGLLLLSMTNRLGRPIDRIRLMTPSLTSANPEERKLIMNQISILLKRARNLQRAILCATSSIFLVAMMIVGLFLNSLLLLNIEILIAWFFALSMFCLVASLGLFLWDISLSLNSIEIEVKHWETP
ncbi:DUF2721 domain-containing protein [Candidatus Bathyarchaeota archaeon]|nr:DUF2721 domain-containing protein [Candidatus Bathyarchaeota archaeon]